MILDSRIKEGKRPLTCFDVEIAKQFEGMKGYFAHGIDDYADLKNTVFGTLGGAEDADRECFCCTEETFDNYYYEFFIPAEWVKQATTTEFKPYTLDTWEQEFKTGDVVFFKGKDGTCKDGTLYKCIYLGYLETEDNRILVILGPWLFGFSELLNLYEIDRSGNWEPFGRKVETIDLNVI